MAPLPPPPHPGTWSDDEMNLKGGKARQQANRGLFNTKEDKAGCEERGVEASSTF
jgi:hypothetical protein